MRFARAGSPPPPNWRDGARRLGGSSLLIWAALLLLYTICFCARNPHPAAAGPVVLNQDMLWNVGNAAALSRAFPAQDIRFVGVRLSYHYFTELVWAALSLVSGADLYDIYVFYAGPLFLAAELIALQALVSSYFAERRPQKYRLLCALLFCFACASLWFPLADGESRFGIAMMRHLVTNINAQATALVYFAAFLCVFIRISRQRFHSSWVDLLALLCAFGLLCVSKGPQAAIVVCSLAVTLLIVLLFQKPCWPKLLLCLAGCAGIFLLAWQLLYSSGSNSMQFSIFAMRNTLCYRVLSPYTDLLCRLLPIPGYFWLVCIGVCNMACMAPFHFFLWIKTLPDSIRHLPRLDPARILLNGITVGGFLAYHLYYHTSSSQMYFALIALLAMSVLAVEPFGALVDAVREHRQRGGYRFVLYLAGAAALLSCLCISANHLWRAAQQMSVTTGLQAPAADGRALTPADEAAMLWLRENADESAVFATNRTSSTPALTDAITNGYSAFSQRQAYMEGWSYAMTNMGVDGSILEHKQWANDLLFTETTAPDEIVRVCADEKIDYLVYAKVWPGGVNPGLTPAYENEEVAIYRILPPEGAPAPQP